MLSLIRYTLSSNSEKKIPHALGKVIYCCQFKKNVESSTTGSFHVISNPLNAHMEVLFHLNCTKPHINQYHFCIFGKTNALQKILQILNNEFIIVFRRVNQECF